MTKEKYVPKDTDEYIGNYDEITQKTLGELRQAIMSVPNMEEKIAWGSPAYYQGGFIVQIAGVKNGVAFYSSPKAKEAFSDELKGYKSTSKNAVHFPLDKEIPADLIKRMVELRLKEK